MLEPDELASQVKALHRTAKAIGMAATWRVQRRIPVLIGPLVPADVMLAGFRAACAGFKVMAHNVEVENV